MQDDCNHSCLLQEEKNGIQLFVSSDRLGISEPRPAEEVIQALNVGVLHQHLGHLGITEISTEVCVHGWMGGWRVKASIKHPSISCRRNRFIDPITGEKTAAATMLE